MLFIGWLKLISLPSALQAAPPAAAALPAHATVEAVTIPLVTSLVMPPVDTEVSEPSVFFARAHCCFRRVMFILLLCLMSLVHPTRFLKVIAVATVEEEVTEVEAVGILLLLLLSRATVRIVIYGA